MVRRRHVRSPIADVKLVTTKVLIAQEYVLFPSKVPDEAENWDHQEDKIEYAIRPQPRNNSSVLSRETDHRRNPCVEW